MRFWNTLNIFVSQVLLVSFLGDGQVHSVFTGAEVIPSENLYQLPNYIDCRNRGSVCQIFFNVTLMQTMTLYGYSNITNERSSKGYPISWDDVQSPPGFRYYGDSPLPSGTFVYPVVADGIGHRNVVAINNSFPGPTIIAYSDQELQIRVLLHSGGGGKITIHWHGLNVPNLSDGVADVTQCPITVGNEFIYRFTPTDTGTFWYHGHYRGERTDGLYGALVSLDRSAPASFYEDLPDKHTLTLIDWQKEEWFVLHELFHNVGFTDPLNPNIEYSPVPISDGTESSDYPFVSGLIGSLGRRYFYNSSHCVPEKKSPLSFYAVTAEKQYRFRLVGVQGNYAFRVSIQNHRMKLLATDSVDVTTDHITEFVDYIIINPGERYDFIPVPLESSPTGSYWIVMETLESPEELSERTYCVEGHRGYAVLYYSGLKTDPPIWYDPQNRNCTVDNPCYTVNCPFLAYSSVLNNTCINVDQLRLQTPTNIPKQNGETIFLNFLNAGGDKEANGINGRNFVPFFGSNILTTDVDICPYPSPFGEIRGRKCSHVYRIPSDADTVDMVLLNIGNDVDQSGDGERELEIRGHPVHLHGHRFRILKMGYPTYNNGVFLEDNTEFTCENNFCEQGVDWKQKPVFNTSGYAASKDTVFVPAGGYVAVRFERQNVGLWFMHCHLVPHEIEGMAMLFEELPKNSMDLFVPFNVSQCLMSPTTDAAHSYYSGSIYFATIGIALNCIIVKLFLVAM